MQQPASADAPAHEVAVGHARRFVGVEAFGRVVGKLFDTSLRFDLSFDTKKIG